MDLRLLESFHAVLEKGSLNAAAAELGYAQSTLTQQIQLLEKRLGVQLFERDGKRLRVSQAGILLRERSASLLQRASELDRFFEGVANGSSGAVRVACVEPFSTELVSIMKPLVQEADTLEVTVEVHGASSAHAALQRGAVDVAIAPPPLHRADVTFEALYFEPVGFLLARNHPLARLKTVELADVAGAPLILSATDCEYRRALEQAAVSAGVLFRSQLTITSIEGRKRAVQEGLGIAIIAASGAKLLPAEIVFRQPKKYPIGVTLGIVTRADAAWQSPPLSKLLTAIRAFVAAKRAA